MCVDIVKVSATVRFGLSKSTVFTLVNDEPETLIDVLSAAMAIEEITGLVISWLADCDPPPAASTRASSTLGEYDEAVDPSAP